MSEGKSVRLFLVDGTPGGLITAEIMNWTGHVIAAPRSGLSQLLKRPEVSRTGIYLLIGEDPEIPSSTMVYVGEGDDIRTRLIQHNKTEDQKGKDFWDRAVVLTSKDANLTKAHARYLENRLINLAKQANRARLSNGNDGTMLDKISLPEADISDMEQFIAQAKIVLPVLGINIFRSPDKTTISPSVNGTIVSEVRTSPIFELHLKKYGISATAQEIDGEFTVLSGSTARPAWTGSNDGYRRLREELINNGTLVLTSDGKVAIFQKNYVFTKPSAAAAVITGRSANGRVEWKLPNSGVTYGAWQVREVEKATEEMSSPTATSPLPPAENTLAFE
jgi:hypothetical protein